MNSKQTLVSIAMCTYNGERFIHEQLDSILTQSHKHIELIITDDGSTDKTIDIIEKYQKADKRIKLYKNKKNLGFIKNFEKAISLCDGAYIALADQDDIWKSEKLETFLYEIKDNLLIYSDAELIDKNSKELNKTLLGKKNLIINNNQAFIFDNCVSGNTLMFSKKLKEYILPIPKDITFHDTWIAFIASTIGSITYTSKPMIYYRRYREQITHNNIVYTSFLDKLVKKEKNIIKQNNIAFIQNSIFLKLPYLDEECKELLTLLNNHSSSFKSGYFDIKLYLYLYKNRDKVFEIKSKRKRKRYARNKAMKLALHKLLLFST